jgi:hypothetical protein
MQNPVPSFGNTFVALLFAMLINVCLVHICICVIKSVAAAEARRDLPPGTLPPSSGRKKSGRRAREHRELKAKEAAEWAATHPTEVKANYDAAVVAVHRAKEELESAALALSGWVLDEMVIADIIADPP